MKRLFYLFTCILLLPSLAKSQSITPDEELDYIIEEFTLPGGRLGNNVNSIVQGPNGFLWFGSHGGLHRYDGYEFVTYKNVPGDTLAESTNLNYQYVEGLYWDKSNMLWITTYGGGLYIFNPVTEKFKNYSHDPDDSTTISHPRVLCAVEDAQGTMWFGTENGLNRFDQETETFTRYYANPDDQKTLQNDDIRSFLVDSQDVLWIGTGFVYNNANSGGLSRYEPDIDSFTSFVLTDSQDLGEPQPSPVRGIFEDSGGNFWVGNAKGLYKMDREEETFEYMVYDPQEPFAPGTADRNNQPVYSILEDKEGGLWIGTVLDYSYKSHLLRHDPVTKTSQILPVQSGAWQLFESADGTIWVAGAGDTGKVLKIKPKAKAYDLAEGRYFWPAFQNSTIGKGLGISVMFGPLDLAIDQNNGVIWAELVVANQTFDSFQVVLGKHDPKSGKTEFHPVTGLNLQGDPNIAANEFGSVGMIIDGNGDIWSSFPSEHIGIYHYNPKNEQLEQYLHDPRDSTSLSSNGIITMMQDSRGEIWAATYDQGLNRLNPTTGEIRQYHFNQDPWSNSDFPIALMEDRDGKIWVTGELMTMEGVFMIVVIDPVTNEIEKIPIPSQYTFNVIHSIAQSPKTGKIMFTVVNNGIGSYDPESGEFDFFNTSNSTFPFDDASGVVCDNTGIFWVSDTDNGRFVRIGESMEFFTIQESSRIGSLWRSGILSPEGYVYFPSLEGGWIDIDPAIIKPESSTDSTRIRLVSLTVLGEKQKLNAHNVLSKPIWMVDKIRLPNEAQSFGFRFSDFDFQNSSSQFQYRLYPFENQWTLSNNMPIANYYKIPPGDYTFQVKSNLSGLVQDRMVELNVVVLPPWWMTWWAYTAYGIFFVAGVFIVDRFQRKRLLDLERSRGKDKELAQARKIEKAYTELKTTQSQLIHAEKMASLGELTAGIAHEIQNPLNFVNNFSEVSRELVEEINEEIKAGNLDEVKLITTDLGQNLEKINHHGQRASGIVKGMLEHSRTGSGEKVLTDINKLADEYLRLSYHGLRAKDKSFNADFKSNFDETLPKVKVIAQDLGRVILNLINNAFYAVSEKAKAADDGKYKPVVKVSTRKLNAAVEIIVQDNGQGIPKEIVDKIFQPFFTTKPSGSGTGLGLSLSYDIIKSHGGEMLVDSKDGEGSKFIITIPI